MHTITLTRDNIVGTDNNRMVYDIPGSKSLEGAEVALSTLYMYYSWQNVNDTTLVNNKFSFTLPLLDVDATGAPIAPINPTFNVVIPPGLYEIADINAYLQQFCIDNNFYLVNIATGEYVYFLQLQINVTLYKCQLNLFALPAGGVPAGYTAPPGGFILLGGAFPSVAAQVVGVDFTVGNFGQLIGAPMSATGAVYVTNPSSSFPPALASSGAFPNGNVVMLSTITPNVQPNSVIFVNCNLIQNVFTNPQTQLYPVPAKTSLGALLQIEPPEYAWNRCMPGQVGQLIITFTDRRGGPLVILDPDIVITLVIRDQQSHLANVVGESTLGMPSSAESLRSQRHPQLTRGPVPTQKDAVARRLGKSLINY